MEEDFQYEVNREAGMENWRNLLKELNDEEEAIRVKKRQLNKKRMNLMIKKLKEYRTDFRYRDKRFCYMVRRAKLFAEMKTADEWRALEEREREHGVQYRLVQVLRIGN